MDEPMLTSLAVFLCQAFHIFLHGIQQQNVIHQRPNSAMGVSLVLGVSSYFITATIAIAAGYGLLSWVALAYILAGPVGIRLAMWAFVRLNGNVRQNVVHRECDNCRVHREQLFFSRHNRNGSNKNT